jgi:hypothetical protein
MRHVLLAAGLMLAASLPAEAGLLGSTIRAEARYPTATTPLPGTVFTPNPFVVGAGVEATASDDIGDFYTVDFSDTGLVITFLDFGWIFPEVFNGVAFSVETGSGFGSILASSTSGGQSITAELVAGELRLNLQNQEFAAGDTITLRFGEPAAVPAPAALGLFGLGLAGLVAVRRRG